MNNVLRKISRNKTLVNGGLFSIYSFMGRGISFLLLMLLANYIPPAEYGSLSLFNTIVSFVTIFMALNTEGYFSISYFKKSEEDFKKNFTSIFIIGIGTLLFFLLLVIIGGNYLCTALALSQNLLIIAVIISFLTFSFHIQQHYFRIQEKVITYGYYNIGFAVLNFVLSLLFVITLKQGWMGRVNAQLTCGTLFGILSIYTFSKCKLFKFDWNKERYKEIIAWGIPMIPHHATTWVRQGLDRYIINFYYATYQVGIFSFALNAANIIEMIGIAFNSTNSVTIFKTLSNKDLNNQEKKEKLEKQTRLIGTIYFAAAIAVMIAMSCITLVALPKYKDSIPYIWILSVSAFLKCVYFLYCNYLFYFSKTKLLMYITFGTSVLHLLLSLVLTQYSLLYTALIYVIIQLVTDIIVYINSKKILKKEINEHI